MRNAAEERAARIGELVERMEAIPDSGSRDTARELMEAILELHGAGMERMIEMVLDSGEAGNAAIRRFAGDRLVSGLLALHDLHPDSVEARAGRAIAKMSGSVELMSVFDGVVKVRLNGAACGLRESVEAALAEAVPDAREIVMEEVSAAPAFVPLGSLTAPVAAA
ncbi:MAG TPA: hypothetical protein VHC90_07845 [Bryobacteraceae bacterium]|nr:hypothetical protein [Bryobacteraceae bacterium]